MALRAILARLIPPSSLTRLVLPAVLTRSVTPPLARATVVPSSSTSCSASAVAPIVALGASTDTAFSHGPELLAFVGVVGVEIVVHAVLAALGRLRLVPAALCVRLCYEHSCSLALHILGLGFLLFWVCCWELEKGEASLLSPCAFGRQVEQLQGCARVFMDC